MKRPTRAAIPLLLAVLSLPAPAVQEGENLNLSLPECIQKTLNNNLGLAAEVLTPQIAEAAVALAGEKFIPSLALSYSRWTIFCLVFIPGRRRGGRLHAAK